MSDDALFSRFQVQTQRCLTPVFCLVILLLWGRDALGEWANVYGEPTPLWIDWEQALRNALPAHVAPTFPVYLVTLLPIVLILLALAVKAPRSLAQAIYFCTMFMYLSVPIVWIMEPDWISAGNLLYRVAGMGVVAVVVVLLQYVITPVLWPHIFRNPHGVTSHSLAPERGFTVQQIKDGIEERRKNFLFGDADATLVRRWGLIGRAMVAMGRTRARVSLFVTISLLIYPVLIYIVSGGAGAAYQRDVARLWGTATSAKGELVSSKTAMNAAWRVFRDKRELRGLTRQQALVSLRCELMNPSYPHNKPQFEWEKNELLVRLTNGKDVFKLICILDPDGKIADSYLKIEYFSAL